MIYNTVTGITDPRLVVSCFKEHWWYYRVMPFAMQLHPRPYPIDERVRFSDEHVVDAQNDDVWWDEMWCFQNCYQLRWGNNDLLRQR